VASTANGGNILFGAHLFRQDIGMPNFPIYKADKNGWNLDQPPSLEEFERIYNSLKEV
jgi:hypothetical protein